MTAPAEDGSRHRPRCLPAIRSWCWALAESLRPQEFSDRALGLQRMVGWTEQTDADPNAPPRFVGIALRGAPRARSIVINYCPFCGVKLREETADAK